MGKDLKGKELGVGISQRKDGLYTARFTDKLGKRRQQYFKKLQDCRNWLADAQFLDEHGEINACGDMTVSAWFEYWIDNIKSGNAKYNTVRNYRYQFNHNIEKYIGTMKLKDVKPMHCQNVINQMSLSEYKDSTIGLTKIAMSVMFEDAVENGLISQNPVTKSVKTPYRSESIPKKAMSKNQQKAFLENAKSSSYFYQYAFILQTGLRTGELVGLKWSDIDFEKNSMYISRTMEYRDGKWRISTPKSKSGCREIPLTNQAIKILQKVKQRKNPIVTSIEYHSLVFLSRNGTPIDNATYNNSLKRICKKANIEHFSMHGLRHTFATRCIEAGMQPKILQEILGHANIGTTMNIYVHITEDSKAEEIKNIESMLNVI